MPTYRLDIDIDWTLGPGSPGTNTWFYRQGGGLALGDLQLATDRLKSFYGEILPEFNASVTIHTDGVWHGVSGTDADEYADVDGWSYPGASSQGHLPMGSSIILERKSSLVGRAGSGRVFLGPVCNTSNGPNGTPAEATRTRVLDAANGHLLLPSTGDGAFVVHSRSTGVSRDVQHFAVPNIFGLLRSRRD